MVFSKLSAAFLALACISNAAVYAVQETVDYVGADDVGLQGYLVYPSPMDSPNARHTVVIVPVRCIETR